MAILARTEIRTPIENTNPFIVQFDTEFGEDLDRWFDANASDIRLFLHATSASDLPTFSIGSGLVSWGNFTVNNSRSAGVLSIATGNIAIADGQCLYVTAPTRPFANQVVVPGVIAIPRLERDRIILGVRRGNIFYRFGPTNVVSSVPSVTDHIASTLLTVDNFEGIHRVNHATNAIDLTLPIIVTSMIGKSAKIIKWGNGNAAFVAGTGNYIADGSNGGRLENTVGAAEAKTAYAVITVVSLTEYSIEVLGGWRTT